MTSREVIVVGWPRSGNTWLARLLADALDSPLVGIPERGIEPIGQEGLDRDGDYLVRQLHLLPNFSDEHTKFIPDSFHAAITRWQGEKLALIIRDPRDVAVSCMFYWGIKTLSDTIWAMAEVEWPIAIGGNWATYYDEWFNCGLPFSFVKYEDLSAGTEAELRRVVSELDLKPANDAATVVQRQAIDVRRQQFVEKKGHHHPYGSGLQIKHLRKGIVGDWRNHFTRKDGEMLHGYFFEAMRRYGYETDEGWFNDLP